jgi:hypothetical protein
MVDVHTREGEALTAVGAPSAVPSVHGCSAIAGKWAAARGLGGLVTSSIFATQ